jgi:hypothetical protein
MDHTGPATNHYKAYTIVNAVWNDRVIAKSEHVEETDGLSIFRSHPADRIS